MSQKPGLVQSAYIPTAIWAGCAVDVVHMNLAPWTGPRTRAGGTVGSGQGRDISSSQKFVRNGNAFLHLGGGVGKRVKRGKAGGTLNLTNVQ